MKLNLKKDVLLQVCHGREALEGSETYLLTRKRFTAANDTIGEGLWKGLTPATKQTEYIPAFASLRVLLFSH